MAHEDGKQGTYIVVHVNARVDDIRTRALAGAIVVHVRGGARLAVRDACEAPGNIVLDDEIAGRHNAVLFDVLNLQHISVSAVQQNRSTNGHTSGSLLTSSNTCGLSRAAKPLNWSEW